MSRPRLLLVEDEPGLVRTLGDRLADDGYAVAHAATGPDGLARALRERFDLILLDRMLPGMDGVEVCRRLRRRDPDVPILMLTARSAVPDKVGGLRAGADDYVVKPFDPDELAARIEALLRRTRSETPGPIRFGDVEIDVAGMAVQRAGQEVELSAMEFQLLCYLARHDGVALTRERILREVWGFQRAPRTRTVDVHVTWLRGKLETDRSNPVHIRTVRGVGYKFVSGDG